MKGWLKVKFKIKIPAEANELIHTLQKNGHSAYVVGGCVRDSILGRVPNDWDICTSATPEEMLQIFKDQKIIKTGLQHGTVTVVINGKGFEITTYRIDGIYSDNRRPDTVEFTDKLIEDLRRRDFTINAMAYNDYEGLIDPFNGLEDLKYKKIRCVGSAKDRFEEDALRILRAIRFSSQLDFVSMPDTDWEIHRQYKRLENISIERINSEFCKIAVCDNFCVQFLLYQDVFSLFIPELKDIIGFEQNNPWHVYDVFDHTVHALEHCESDDLIVNLAVFFHDFGKPRSYQDGEDGVRHFYGHAKASSELTDSIMKRLKFDNDTREKVTQLVSYHDATLVASKANVKKWLNKLGEEQFRRLLEVKKADNMAQNPDYIQDRLEELAKIKVLIDEVITENECFSLKDLAVNGKDLIDIGYKPGKKLGSTLNALLAYVIADDAKNEKAILLELAEVWK